MTKGPLSSCVTLIWRSHLSCQRSLSMSTSSARQTRKCSKRFKVQSWSKQRYNRSLATKAAATSDSVVEGSQPDRKTGAAVCNPTKEEQYELRTVDIGYDEPLILHFKQARKLVSIKARHIVENTTVHLGQNEAVYHLDKLALGNLREGLPVDSQSSQPSTLYLTVRESLADKTNPGTNIESVHDVEWREQKLELRKLLDYYKMLSKIRLTGLVVLTTVAGYWIAPGAVDISTLFWCTTGTALTSSCANSINQYFEVPYDSQMNRTKNRVLVKGLLSPLHAVGFAFVSGVTGLCLLSLGANPIVAGLGAFNLCLYTLAYTPLKRLSIVNTWVGAIVGAIPPVMGWAACTGGLEPGAFLLAGILFSWQFPHFNALSWNLRPDYSRAGYRMMSVVDPALCRRVAFRHCLLLTGMCLTAPPLGVTTWTFAVDSLPLNLYLCYLGWRFYRKGDSNSSRKLFRFTLIHIPALLLLMGISKATFGSHEKHKGTSKLDSAENVASVESS